jgi:hypothetical protein
MTKLVTVPFHSDNLFLAEHNGEPYTPMRPLVEGMGLVWASQFVKLKSNPRFCVSEIEMQMPGDDQKRSVTCMPLRKLPGWLMTLHPKKVRSEIRDKIVMYQNECDDALWSYWTKGQAENADDSEPSTVLERTPLYLDVVQAVIRHRLMFPVVYKGINDAAGSEAFRLMTKKQIRTAKPFARRIANGTATPQDWQILDSKRKAFGYGRAQPELDGFGPPALK